MDEISEYMAKLTEVYTENMDAPAKISFLMGVNVILRILNEKDSSELINVLLGFIANSGLGDEELSEQMVKELAYQFMVFQHFAGLFAEKNR